MSYTRRRSGDKPHHGSKSHRYQREKKSEASGSSDGGKTTRLGHVSRIPWTAEETSHVKELMEYLSIQLQEGAAQMPIDEGTQLLNVVQEFLKQDELDRNDPLLSKIAYYFDEIQTVDLDKVARLLKSHKETGELLKGKDVILLLGGPSSGKTTTLHSLAGTAFQEVDVDGFCHLQPTHFLDPAVSGYETSSSRCVVTNKLQTATVNMYDHDFIVCDTPGFGLYDCIEEEIAHSHGMVEAICHARTVRPVFVLSQECLGNRLSGFPEIFNMMTSYFDIPPARASRKARHRATASAAQGDLPSTVEGVSSDDEDDEPTPFQYVFTRFEERHRTRLCKMFKYLHETADGYDEETHDIYTRVVDDIVDKTTPEATIVSPNTDIPRYLLRKLLEYENLVCEPRDWMKPYSPEPTKALLHAQLKLNLYGILMFLANQQYQAAVDRVAHFQELSEVLPDAASYYDLALRACDRYAIMLWESFHERMEERDFGSGLVHVTQSIQLAAALPDIEDELKLSHQVFWERFTELSVKAKVPVSLQSVRQLREMCKYQTEMQGEVKRGLRVIKNSILKDFSKEDDIAKACLLLIQLIQLGHGFKDASLASTDLLDRLEVRIQDRMKEKEFRRATADLSAMGPLAQAFPEKTKYALYAVKMYKQALDRSIDKKVYDVAGDLLLDLTQLQVYYPISEKYMTKGLDQLWKVFSYAIKQREYCTAVCIVKHMSKVAHVSLTAYERSRLGIEVIRDRLFKSIKNKDYSMAQTLMQQLNKLEKMLPKSMKPKENPESAVKMKQQVHKDSSPSKRRHREERDLRNAGTERNAYDERRDEPAHDFGSIVKRSFDEDLSELTMSDDLRALHEEAHVPREITPKSKLPPVTRQGRNSLEKYTKSTSRRNPFDYPPTTRSRSREKYYESTSAPPTKHKSRYADEPAHHHNEERYEESRPHHRGHHQSSHKKRHESPPSHPGGRYSSAPKHQRDYHEDDDEGEQYYDEKFYEEQLLRGGRSSRPRDRERETRVSMARMKTGSQSHRSRGDSYHHHPASHHHHRTSKTGRGREDFSTVMEESRLHSRHSDDDGSAGSRTKQLVRQVNSMLDSVITEDFSLNTWDV